MSLTLWRFHVTGFTDLPGFDEKSWCFELWSSFSAVSLTIMLNILNLQKTAKSFELYLIITIIAILHLWANSHRLPDEAHHLPYPLEQLESSPIDWKNDYYLKINNFCCKLHRIVAHSTAVLISKQINLITEKFNVMLETRDA